MSGLDGEKLFHVLAPTTPIVFCTGYWRASDDFGTHHAVYLCKPVEMGELISVCSDLLNPRGPYALCVGELGLGAANYRLLSGAQKIAQDIHRQLSSGSALDTLLNHKVQDFIRDYCHSQRCDDPRDSCARLLSERMARLQKLMFRRQRARDGSGGFLQAYAADVQFDHARATVEMQVEPAVESIFDTTDRGIFLRLCVMELVDNALSLLRIR